MEPPTEVNELAARAWHMGSLFSRGRGMIMIVRPELPPGVEIELELTDTVNDRLNFIGEPFWNADRPLDDVDLLVFECCKGLKYDCR